MVAVDGKAMKRAYEKGRQYAPRMMVTAWGAEARMSLAARPVVDGDETNAAIEMLANLDIKGAIITGDALHCNRRMAQTIIDRGADYVLPIKGNQDSLLSDARAKIGAAKRPPTAKTEDEAHGRIETRRAVVVAAGDLGEHHEFAGLKAVGMIEFDAYDRRQDPGVRALLRTVAPPQAGRTAAHQARALGHREPPALAARRRARRGHEPHAQGQRPGQPRHAAPPRAQHRAHRQEQRITRRQAPKSRLERRRTDQDARPNAIALRSRG